MKTYTETQLKRKNKPELCEISVDDYNDMKKARDYYMRKSSELTKEIKKLNNLKIK